LSDVLVVETSDGVAVAFCGKLLADYGATVVKVERPAGDGTVREIPPFVRGNAGEALSALHLFLNANKRSICLDYESPAGTRLFRKLVDAADVLISFGGGGPQDAPDSSNTGLITVSLSWFGESGPWKGFSGNDFLAQHMSGMAFATAVRVDDPSTQPPVATPGHLAEMVGGLTAATSTLMALFERDFQGQVDHVDVAIVDAITSFMRQEIVMYSYGAGLMSRSSAARSPFAAPVYQQRTADGYVDLLILQEGPWRALVEILGSPDWANNELFATHPLRSKYWDALEPLLQTELQRVTTGHLYTEGQERGVPVSPINTVADAAAAAQFAERGYFRDGDHPTLGTVRYPGPPFAFTGQHRRPAAARDRGADNAEVLGSWLGSSADELAAMAEAGVI
jgi:crotonobetainyl-CoA:carnitine CoA-transferase CaiB-like acyl-CoA transferase